MSRLATQLPTAEAIATRVRRGPSGACDIYGDGDLDDWRAVERLRLATCWVDAHKAVDETLDITEPIDTDKFRYHWRRRCWHWSEAQRRVELVEDAA
jgi:hypothetical protein